MVIFQKTMFDFSGYILTMWYPLILTQEPTIWLFNIAMENHHF